MNGKQPTAVARPLPADKRASTGSFARSVGAFVPKVVAPAFERFGFHSAEIMTSWATIVGADLARLSRPNAIKWPRGTKTRAASDDDDARSAGATLVLDTDPAFALEISYRTQEIIDRINRYFGYRAIRQVRVVQAPQTATAEAGLARAAMSTPEPTVSNVADGIATEELGAALDALANSIKAARTHQGVAKF